MSAWVLMKIWPYLFSCYVLVCRMSLCKTVNRCILSFMLEFGFFKRSSYYDFGLKKILCNNGYIFFIISS